MCRRRLVRTPRNYGLMLLGAVWAVGLEHLKGLHLVTEAHVAEADRVAGSLGRSVRQRVLAWRADMIKSAMEGSSSIYKWLRYGVESLTMVEDEGVTYYHPPRVLEAVHRFWSKIIAPPGYEGINAETMATA
eukprot:4710656-Amphidinium_carterae.1